MKRDWNLIRLILLQMGDADLTEYRDTWPDSKSKRDYHLRLLHEAGWIVSDGENTRLTMQGHDFLDLCREFETWGKVQEAIKRFGKLPTEIVISILLKAREEMLLQAQE